MNTRWRMVWIWAGLLAGLMAVPASRAQFTGGTRFGSSRSSTTYPSATEVGSAMITSDTESRKLIVVTDDATAAQISNVVASLDRPAPQVIIKVVFLEVTYRKGSDIGIEGSWKKDIGNNQTGIVNQVFGLASEGATPTSPAGLYQVMSADWQATLRAIAEAGKTEILSRPTILARNNQMASINVGQEVPLITDVRFDNYGNQILSPEYRDVGIILEVTPFITSGGLIELIVAPEISALSEETVPIAAGVEAPVINSRRADTVVITPDGQTVVIGGLMQNLKTHTDTKIPLLGDIPLLGAAFRRRVTSDVKTELLIFLTPHIVKDPMELAGIARTERAAATLAPKSFTEDELNRYLETVPAKETPPQDSGSPTSKTSSKSSSKKSNSNPKRTR